MDDASLVRVFQGFGDLEQNILGFGGGNGALRIFSIAHNGLTPVRFDAIGERRAGHQLHDQSTVFDAVDGGDAGVIERRQHAGFALKAGQTFGIAGDGRGENLDGDVALELRVEGAVHLAHAALADHRKDFVVAELVAGGQGHGASTMLTHSSPPHSPLLS